MTKSREQLMIELDIRMEDLERGLEDALQSVKECRKRPKEKSLEASFASATMAYVLVASVSGPLLQIKSLMEDASALFDADKQTSDAADHYVNRGGR